MAARAILSRRIGFHVSIAGGLSKAIGRALERGCTALQIFCGSPRSWRLARRAPDEVADFRAERSTAGLSPLVVHSCYLINPCASDPATRRRGISRLCAELRLAAELGADCYVLHPGSNKGRTPHWLVERAARSIARALAKVPCPPPLLLEDTATVHGPGGDFATLSVLMHRLKELAPGAETGVAVDSCHAFAAGYDFRQAGEMSRLAADLAQTVGLDKVRLLHVNDARDGPGSRRDRHEHIGRGAIGSEGLRNLLNHPAFEGLPIILETPCESVQADRRNLRAVLKLLHSQ